MSIHDRAAAAQARRHTLTVTRYLAGCMQTFEFECLTASEVEAEKRWQRESSPGYELWFDVTTT